MNRNTLILLSLLLCASLAAMANDDHGHAHGDDHGPSHAEDAAHDHAPKHGGIVTEADDLVFELVGDDSGVRLYVRDHGEPLDLKGGNVKLTAVSKAGKQDIGLAPAGDHFAATAQLPPGSRVVARVTFDGHMTAVRFAMP